jgi:methylated-DNA-protein-cysteine methyltransferase-like protein
LPGSIRKAIALLPTGRGKLATPRRSSSHESAAVQTILDVVCTIPRGYVSTYGAVARAAGLPGRARLTGYALKRAPDTLNIPWHRVLGAGGRIVFPRYSSSYREQAQRLRAEGVKVRSGRIDRVFLTDLETL